MFVFAILAICSAYGGVIPLAAPTLLATPHAAVIAEPLAARTVITGAGEATVVTHSAHVVHPLALAAPLVATHIW